MDTKGHESKPSTGLCFIRVHSSPFVVQNRSKVEPDVLVGFGRERTSLSPTRTPGSTGFRLAYE